MKGDTGIALPFPPLHSCIFLHLAAPTKRVEAVSAQGPFVAALFPQPLFLNVVIP
jgi:hypothetical protein